MRVFTYLLLVFAFVSVLSACVNISDVGTWGTALVNVSDVLYVNENATLCEDTYYLDAAALAPVIRLNASGVHLDCNQSIIDGTDKDGYGIMAEELTYNRIENCTVRNYEWGFYVLTSNHTMFEFNTAYNNTEHGAKFQDSANNTIIHNVAYNNTGGGGIQLDTSTFNNISNNTAYGNSYGIILSDNSNNNNIVNNTAYNSTYAFVVITAQYNLLENNTAYDSRVGYLISGAENNTINNNEAYNSTGDGGSTGFGFFNSITFGSTNLNNYSNNTAHDCQYYGFDIYDSDFILFSGNTAYNNSHGFFFYTDNSTIIGNEAYNNSNTGIYFTSANGNNVSHNIAHENIITAGIEISTGIYNILTNNTAYDNEGFGFYFYNEANYNNVSNSTAYDNPTNVYLVFASHNILDNITTYGGSTGFGFGSGSYNNMSNLTAHDHSFYGFQFASAFVNSTLMDFAAYQNQYGLYSFGMAGNNITNCNIYGNFLGMVLSFGSSNNSVSNCVSYNNSQQGFYLDNSLNTTMVNNTAFNNTLGGLVVTITNDSTIVDTTIYNNLAYGIQLGNTASRNNITNMFIYNQSQFISGSGSGENNFTNLTIGYNATVGLINFGFANLTDIDLIMVEATPSIGTVFLSPNFVSLKDETIPQMNLSANITIETDNCSKGVLKELGFPYTLADILDTGTHYTPLTLSCVGGIARFGVPGFSGYALGEEITYPNISFLPDTTVVVGTETNITCNASNSEANLTLYRDGVKINSSFSYVQEIDTLAAGTYFYECNASGNGNYSNATVSGTLTVTTCTNISSPMEYTMIADASGYRTYSGIFDACIFIESSDVTLNCDGHSITGDWSAPGSYYGILVNPLAALTNVSIINCSVSNYTDGVYVSSSYGTVMDNDLFNNTEAGLYTIGTDNNISQNLVHNNTASGIFSTGAGNRIFNNTIYDCPGGPGLMMGADYHVAFNNTIFGTSFGAYVNSASYNNLTDNRITNNTVYGIYIEEALGAAAGYNNIINNIVANNSLFQMLIDDSYDNVIYNNIFNASGAQGVISSNTYEYWNTSKTLGTNAIGGAYKGGNFYSNYTGVDTDGDGLGNTPYIVNQYTSSTPQKAYSDSQASTGTWTDFTNTYDQDWDTYGVAQQFAEGYYNFTIPVGASTTQAVITTKAGAGVEGDSYLGSLYGYDCLSSDPLQVRMVATDNKGAINAYLECYDYTFSSWGQFGNGGNQGSATEVNFYELNATFLIGATSNSYDYLPLTNNLNYAPNITIVSIGGQANNSEISDLTPDIIFNATDLDNSTLNCTVYVDSITAGGTNDTVENGTLTTITLNYSLTAGQSYDFTVNCSDNTTISASGVWTETVPSASTTSSSSNPSQNEPLSIIAEEEVPLETVMQITVEREGHVTLPNALVTVTFAGDTVFTGYTDSWGRVYFTPENAGLYRITSTKLGYVAANDSFVAVATECASSNDCAYDKACTDGRCTQIPEGECGTYSNHAWEDYACCASSDCGEGFSCTNHECVQRSEEPETGCTIDTQCQQGYRCASGICVQEPVIEPPECVLDTDCSGGFSCANNTCVQLPPTEGGTTTPPEGAGQVGGTNQQGGIFTTVVNLWWLWLILIALVAWYLYRKNREKK